MWPSDSVYWRRDGHGVRDGEHLRIMSQPTAGNDAQDTSERPRFPITERGIVAKGARIASAMSDAPRGFLARAPVIALPEVGFVWQDYIAILERYAPERRVFALDWPGLGGSDKPTTAAFPYTVTALAETFGAWLDGLGVARAIFVANGVGGAAAIRFAAAHPNRVAGLALLAPVGFANETRSSKVMSWAIGRARVLRRTQSLATSLALGPTNDATRAVTERHRALRSAPDRDESLAAVAALWRDATRADDLASVARQVQAPAQVFRGALDPVVTAEESRRATTALGQRGALEVALPDAGHLPFLQQPERFFQALTGLIHTAELAAAQLS